MNDEINLTTLHDKLLKYKEIYPDIIEEFEERAAIIQFGCNVSKEYAEFLSYKRCFIKILKILNRSLACP